MLHIPLVGDLQLLTDLISVWANTLVIHLFQNNYTPVDGTVVGDFVEATFDGYGSQGVSTWGSPTIVGPRGQTQAASNTWTKAAGTNPNLIYGYYILDGAGNLLWAERDPAAPIPMNVAMDTYTITPGFTTRSEF